MSSIDDSRFTPGTLLAGRFRIVGRLGRGGMGEVYRADDLKLGQAVALKFLPEAFVNDPRWLRRFNDEVRIARDVAHPNVCRTYDIVEADSEHFITMEYVDGEDLSSLLRRIGRLPQNKAIEIARQLCAGLAAAHDKGVLHRDLKPANVMLDGRGRVRITDFGIAALAEELHGKDVRSGTPAYMAPEQLNDGTASVRSDIYSLGLVLYEVFTGREAFHAESLPQLEKMRKTGSPATPSTLVQDIDPLVERVIMRCLENDPRERPSSAIAVAAALPGGDPLALALAAGETPSPEMVAQAGESGAMRPRWAVACLVAALALGLFAGILGDQINLLRLLPTEKGPEVLVDRAKELHQKLGYTDVPGDTAIWFGSNQPLIDHLEELPGGSKRYDVLRTGRIAALVFAYRTSPEAMVPQIVQNQVWADSPPFTTIGGTLMTLDVRGRLIRFRALPLQYIDDASASTSQPTASPPPPDWSVLFNAAGLDITTFASATPRWIPMVPYDRHMAWTGVFPEHPDMPIRIEAASLQGRFVWFDEHGPWNQPPIAGQSGQQQQVLSERIGYILFSTLFMGIPVVAGALAWRNLRAGRGDRRGAWRLGLFIVSVSMITWMLKAHHIADMNEMWKISEGLASALLGGVTTWVMYLAVEPYARRYWPQSIIAWTRLLSGRWRDPLVGRHVLLAVTLGATLMLAFALPFFIAKLADSSLYQPELGNVINLTSPRYALAGVFDVLSSQSVFMGLFVILLVLRILFRRQWIATTVVAAIMLFFMVAQSLDSKAGGVDWYGVAGGLAATGLLLLCLLRLGLLGIIVMTASISLFFSSPFTLDFSRWYATQGLLGVLAFVALAAYGFWIALAGQPLLKDEMHG